MKRFLKWAAAIMVVVAVVGFLAFLYNIPPFFLTPPETFGADMAKAAPPVDGIADPAQRAIAARGRQIVDEHRLHGLPRHQRFTGSGYDEVPAGRRDQDRLEARHLHQPQSDAGSRNRAGATNR